MGPLSGCKISTTGLLSEDNILIEDTVRSLGGEYSHNLDKETNYLLVRKVGSEKQRMVLTMNTQCVRPEWVFECQKQKRMVDVSAFSVSPFAGLTISVTQLYTDRISQRKEFEVLLTKYGATYSANLVKERCTHLIAERPSGEKFERAQRWGTVKTCSKEWIDECIRKGCWLPEEDFPVIDTDHFASKSAPLTAIRGIDSHHLQQPTSTATTTSLPSSLSLPLQALSPSTSSSSSSSSSSCSSSSSVPSDEERLAKLCDLGSVPASKVFSADIFFIGGFTDANRDYVLQLVLRGGGHLSSFLCDKVTKVVLGQHASSEMKDSLRRLISHSAVDVVTLEFLSHVALHQQEVPFPVPKVSSLPSDMDTSTSFSSGHKSPTEVAPSASSRSVDATKKPETKSLRFATTGKRKLRQVQPFAINANQSPGGMASRILQRNQKRNEYREEESQFVTWANSQFE